LGSSGDHVHVHEPRLAAHFVITVGHGDHDALVQPHNQLNAGVVDHGVEKSHFERAGIGEQIFRARRLCLRHNQFAACACQGARSGYICSGCSRFRRLQRLQNRLRRRRCKSHRRQVPEQAAPRQ